MSTKAAEIPKTGFIPGRTVAEFLSVSERSLPALAAAGTIPAPVRFGHRTVRWNAAELRQKLGL